MSLLSFHERSIPPTTKTLPSFTSRTFEATSPTGPSSWEGGNEGRASREEGTEDLKGVRGGPRDLRKRQRSRNRVGLDDLKNLRTKDVESDRNATSPTRHLCPRGSSLGSRQ